MQSSPDSFPSRRFVLTAIALLPAIAAGSAHAQEPAWRALREPGAIVLMRHATAPGVGDPPGMRLDDCASQRNLDERGRSEARRMGEAFRERRIEVGRVVSSRWCRARETARLAFGTGVGEGAEERAAGTGRGVPVQDEPAFDSFFGEPGLGHAQTLRARELLAQWKGPGALVVVTHQVNIRALTGITTASAEALVVRVPPGDGPLVVVGRVTF